MGTPKSKPRKYPENPYDACLTLSYARPTLASEARRALSKLHISSTNAPPSHPAKQSPPTPKTPVQRNGKISFLSRHIRPKPPNRRYTGFFDLPAELRNAIYELTCLFTSPRNLNFHRGPHHKRPRSTTTPALLRADIRLLVEAGSYYFSSNVFDIIISRGDSASLSAWLRFIGRSNRVCLAKNAGVILRLVPTMHGCDGKPAFRTRVRPFVQPAELCSRVDLIRAGIGPAVTEALRWLPARDSWKWTRDCRCQVLPLGAEVPQVVGPDHDAHERAHRQFAARRGLEWQGLVWRGYLGEGGTGEDDAV